MKEGPWQAVGTVAFLGILLALAIFAASSVSGPQHGRPIEHTTTTPEHVPQASERGTKAVPFVVETIPGYRTEAEEREARREQDRKAETDRQLILATWWLVGVTALLVLVAASQAALFVWQLGLMREAADDAKTAANASRESADTAKLSMIASERAYVHHNGCRWVSHRDPANQGIFWRIRPRWINSGNTPTRKLNVFIRYELTDKPITENFAFTIDESAPVPAALAPKGIIESASYDIHAADLAAVRDGTKHFYILGIARYGAPFPDTPRYVTRFCVVADIVTGDPAQMWNEATNPVEIRFRTYGWHNCADEDCEGQGPI